MELPCFTDFIRHSISAYITGVFPEWNGVIGLYGTSGKLFVYNGSVAKNFHHFQWRMDLMKVEQKKSKGKLQKWIIIEGIAVGSQLIELFDDSGLSCSFSLRCEADIVASYKKLKFPEFDPMRSRIDIQIVPNSADRVPDINKFDEKSGELLTMLLLSRTM